MHKSDSFNFTVVVGYVAVVMVAAMLALGLEPVGTSSVDNRPAGLPMLADGPQVGQGGGGG